MIENRIERKLPTDAVGLALFREWLLLHGSDFRAAFAPRRVQSIYFDSIDLADFADNVDGVSQRTKVRMRWYGNSLQSEQVRVECKQKRAGTSWKQVAELPDPLPLDGSLRLAHRAARAVLPTDLRAAFDRSPFATLWNRYDREYFSTRDGLRLTLDTGLCAADIVRDRLEPRRLRPSAVHAVIELKYPVSREPEMRDLLGQLRLRVGRHSKYASGVDNSTL